MGSGDWSSDCNEIRADLSVRIGDQAEPSVSKQIAPCLSVRTMIRLQPQGLLPTVTLDTFGCQIFVSNLMVGGWKGYSLGILMST